MLRKVHTPTRSVLLALSIEAASMAPQLYRRIFSRTVTPDDQDVLADDAFIRANFVDVFGALLADGTLSSMFTYQEMAPWFYGKSPTTTR